MHNLGWQICDAFRYFASSSQSRSPVCAALPASFDLSWVASVIVSSASLGVQVGQGPLDLVVTISLRRGIVGHCFTLAHDLQEPSVYELILLASAVIAEFVNFAAQIIVILVQWRSCA